MDMAKPHLVSAICTPLTQDEDLHHEGLLTHLDHQSSAGIDGILVAGTMGLLQLLRDATYEQLVKTAASYWKGQGEILVGVGDASYVRTKERIEFVNHLAVDGTVALAPYFIKLSQTELFDYYTALAGVSRAPLFLYDLPQRTGTNIAFETVVRLARHPNIAGIKCSGDLGHARCLHDELSDSGFRVLVAQPLMLDALVTFGMTQHLDGLFCLAPQWARRAADAAAAGDFQTAAAAVRRLEEMAKLLARYGVFGTATYLLQLLNVAGAPLPRPLSSLTDEQKEQVLAEPVVRELLAPERETLWTATTPA